MRIEIICLIIVGITLVLFTILLILTGITRTGKNKALVIERMDKFYEVTKEGYVYRHPFLYHVVGRYSLREEKAMNKFGEYSLTFTYQIVDPKTYHYSGHCFLDRINEKMSGIDKVTPEIIKEKVFLSAEESGVEINSLEIYNTSDDSN